jgi:hypothetical protein
LSGSCKFIGKVKSQPGGPPQFAVDYSAKLLKFPMGWETEHTITAQIGGSQIKPIQATLLVPTTRCGIELSLGIDL